MVDRLYENLLELISKRQEQYCNSTLCNLNAKGADGISVFAEL